MFRKGRRASAPALLIQSAFEFCERQFGWMARAQGRSQ